MGIMHLNLTEPLGGGGRFHDLVDDPDPFHIGFDTVHENRVDQNGKNPAQ